MEVAASAVPPAAPVAAPAAGAASTALTGAVATPPAGDKAAAAVPPPAAAATDGKTPAAVAATPAELELKLPDGFKADDAALGAFKAHAKEFGLKSEQAQKLFDLYAGSQKAAEAARVAEQEQQQKTWVEAIKADQDIGGARLDASVQSARKAMQRFGSPELKTFLEESGLGNHPELVRAFAKAGRLLAEDSVAGSSNNGAATPANSEEALHRQLYPSMFPKG